MKDGPTVLGIAGGTASGKTTAAERLVERLGDRAQLLTHDRYYHSLPERYRARPVEWNFDAPEALDTPRLVRDLTALRAGRSVWVPRYDFARHQRAAEEDPLHPTPVIVVEGILVLSDPVLSGLFDHRVYVHTPDDIRLMRRIRRDVATRGRAVDEILAQYEATVRPMHVAHVEPSRDRADLVLDGTAPVEELVARLLTLLS